MIFLIIYGEQNHPGITYEQCFAAPHKYKDALVEIGTETTITKIFPDSFIIRQMRKNILVHGIVPEHAKIGDFVTVIGNFQVDGGIRLQNIRVAEKRRQKIWVSLFPILLVAFLLLRKFSWNWKTLTFTSR